jgi:hypothetical protein
LNFGIVNLGTESSANASITNTSLDYITISNVNLTGPGFNASGVPSGIILAPGETATLNIVFAPSGAGIATGNIAITSNAASSPTNIPLSGTGINPPHSVDLSWIPSASSAFGYFVYRATNQFGPYTKLNSIPVNATQYTDVSVLAGQSYIYWVTAVDLYTIESSFSDPVTVIVPTP